MMMFLLVMILVSFIHQGPFQVLQFACDFVFELELELGMGSVDTVCDTSNRHVSHGHPMDVAQPAYAPS